jgi:HEAT repeat protein/DNA replication protein DnaC
MSRDYQFTEAETESFLLQFARQNLGKSLTEISEQLPQMEEPLGTHKKRMSEVYNKFFQKGVELKPKNNKSKALQKWLETQYSQWLPVQDFDSALSSATTETPIDWRELCRDRLEKQKQLTTNRLMLAKAMVFNIEDIDVDLALVERKNPDKRSGDERPEKSRFYLPDYEETEKLEYQEFLAKVLKSNQSNKIAVIGEPGGGKTTLLQRIAFWILENTDYLPIWIPLGNLPTPAPQLKEYLLNRWLEDAIFSVTPEIRANFEKQLTAGKVWLLLDSVDEMAESGNPLIFIEQWLPDWSHNLPVMLTCRLNVWEANPYALNGFKTYRTLWFSEEKVKQFIHDGFQKSAPALGVQLEEALNQPGKERIKDLVRNPLRLMLLCSIWHLLDGKLPDTKAELYQHYVEEVYRWKEDEFPTTSEERKQLNAKLGELAKKAIDKQENRFCWRMEFVKGVLGEGSLFQLALKVGWLNQVGVDAKNPLKPVYAFYHPTFQEYFAATAIDDWDFFLPRQHQDKPVADQYRIFESQWKEVILLWLGRPEERLRKQKEEFIKALVEFEDGCDEFYRYRAYFLVTAGITEFLDCNYADFDFIVDQLVEKAFGYFSDYKQEWVTFVAPIAEASRAIIAETDRKRAINALIKFIHNTLDEKARCLAASSLGKIDQTNQVANSVLLDIIQNSPNESLRRLAASILGEIDTCESIASHTLLELLCSSQDENIRWLAVAGLSQMGKSNQEVHSALMELIETSQDKNVRKLAFGIIGLISQSYPLMVATIENIIRQSKSEENCNALAGIIWQIDRYNSEAISTLIKLKIKSNNEDMRELMPLLEGIDKYSTIKIYTLEALIPKLQYEESLKLVADILWQIDQNNCLAIATFLDLLDNCHEQSTRWLAADRLSGNDKYKSTVIRILEELINKSQDEWIRRSAADSLLKVDKFNSIAIAALVEIVNKSQDNFILQLAIASLEKTSIDSPELINALLNLIEQSQSEYTRQLAASCLSKIAKNNVDVIRKLLHIAKNSQNGSSCWQAVYSLMNLLTEVQKQTVITELKDYCFNNVVCFEACYQLIWHCAQTLPYLTFYAAWNNQHTTFYREL